MGHPPGTTVLIVDDDRDILEALGELLGDEGFAVATARDGAEALEKLRTGLAPAVIFLDLMMPIVDGWEFRAAQMADARLARIPTVIMSARADFGDTLGVAMTLRKPLTSETVLAAVNRCIPLVPA